MFDKKEKLYEHGEEKLRTELFRAMIYSTGEIDCGICCSCCSKNFKKKGVDYAMSFTRRIYYSAIGLMVANILVALTELIADFIGIGIGKYSQTI